MSKTTLEVLQGAYHLLDDKSRWTQRVAARDALGNSTDELSYNAVSWCAIGALSHVANKDVALYDAAYLQLAATIHADHPGRGITTVNDGWDGYEQIRAAFRKTIARLSPKPEPLPAVVEIEDREPALV